MKSAEENCRDFVPRPSWNSPGTNHQHPGPGGAAGDPLRGLTGLTGNTLSDGSDYTSGLDGHEYRKKGWTK